jgi:hypothetical protein
MSFGKILKLSIPLTIAIALPVLSFVYFPPDLLYDDSAFTLKYIDNLIHGFGYRFNASDADPIFGSSSFLFTIVASLFRVMGIESDFLYIRLPGLIGYFVVLALAFQTLNRSIGFFAGMLGLITVAVFPQYFAIADSGLESMFGGALLCAALYIFYFQLSVSWLMFICAALVITKLDLVTASVILGAGQIVLSFADSGETRRSTLLKAFCLYVVPALLFFGFCRLYFGSVIPNSLEAKLSYLSNPGDYAYIKAFFSGYYLPVFCLSSILLLVFAVICVIEKKSPSFRFLVIFTLSAVLLTQVWSAPFQEVFLWYFIIPFLAFQFLALFAVIECRTISSSSTLEKIYKFSFPAVVFLMLLSATLGVFGKQFTFANCLTSVRTWLDVVERERRGLGKLVASPGTPQSVLSTGYGWSAYDSKMKVLDHFGINTRQPVIEKWGLIGWLDRLKETAADFIICHKAAHPLLAGNYDLIALGWATKYGGHSELEVYRKKEEPLNFKSVTFLTLGKAVNLSPDKDKLKRFTRITDSDCQINANGSGAIAGFPDVSYDNSLVGVYCYLVKGPDASTASEVTFCLEAEGPGLETVRTCRAVSFADGIALLTLKVPGAAANGTLKITCISHNSHGLVPHFRDAYITSGSF